MAEAIFEVFRGNREGGQAATYRVPIAPGMVVLDALHHIQAYQAPDLADILAKLVFRLNHAGSTIVSECAGAAVRMNEWDGSLSCSSWPPAPSLP